MTALVIVAVGLVVAFVIVRLCGWLLTRTAEQVATEWCEICGDEMTEGWAIHEVLVSTGDPMEALGGGTAMSAYWCAKHRPDDQRAVPWCA